MKGAIKNGCVVLAALVVLTACGGSGKNANQQTQSSVPRVTAPVSSVSSQSSLVDNLPAVSSSSVTSSDLSSSTSSLLSSSASSEPSSLSSSMSSSQLSSISSVSSSSLRSSSSSSSSSARSSSVGSHTPSQRAVENQVSPTAWTLCSQQFGVGGSSCEFQGLREIRFGTDGKWVSKRFLNSMLGSLCRTETFGSDPAPGEAKRCEYSNLIISGTIAPPVVCHMNEMCPHIDLTAIPMGSAGLGELRVRAATVAPSPAGDGQGAFRTVCGFSHMAFDDPIVYPGQPGVSHLHAFFGNTGVDAYSTAESLANSGNSTCFGGIANRSAYWVPAMIDTSTGRPIVPDDPIWYYKTGHGGVAPADVNAMPSGLRMIAGNMNAASPQAGIAYWGCFGVLSTRGASIPNCDVGQYVTMTVRFPQCWDGVNLDSADHKGHMAYTLSSSGGCPASHPHPIPEITLNVKYKVEVANEALAWRLSSDHPDRPAGYSGHADWFDGWNPQIRDTWVEHCNKTGVDCHAQLLGDGRSLH